MNRFDITIEEGQHLFLTSDTHFGHENIIKYCSRPFTSADEMDAEMITRWNIVVQPDDVVIHLGDIAFKNRRQVEEIVSKLNGKVYLVVGNHDDPPKIRRTKCFAGVSYDTKVGSVIVPELTELYVNGELVAMLSHYPKGEWYDGEKKIPFFFGHIHTSEIKKIEDGPYDVIGSYDVGVDNNNFCPLPIEMAIAKAWRHD